MELLEKYEATPEAAERLGVSLYHVSRLAKQGRFPKTQNGEPGAIQLRGRWFIHKDSVPERITSGVSGKTKLGRPPVWAKT